MSTARVVHTATLLPNGQVLVAGGQNSTGYLASAELYDPVAGTFTAAGSLNAARLAPEAALLPTGQVLIAGGVGPSPLASAELYDPVAGTFTAAGNMTSPRAPLTMTLLRNGQVLIVGANGDDSVDLYQSAAPTLPTVSCVPAGPTGGTFQVSASNASAGTPTIQLGSFVLANGEVIKINETDQAGVRLVNVIGPDRIKHFHLGKGEAVITATDAPGNVASAICR
jgi:hypothetical protein